MIGVVVVFVGITNRNHAGALGELNPIPTSCLQMKHILLTTIAAALLVG